MKKKFKIIDAGVPTGTSSGEKLKLGERQSKTCLKCNGTGVEDYWDHGFAEHGLEAIEAIRCQDCDGFGYIIKGED